MLRAAGRLALGVAVALCVAAGLYVVALVALKIASGV